MATVHLAGLPGLPAVKYTRNILASLEPATLI